MNALHSEERKLSVCCMRTSISAERASLSQVVIVNQQRCFHWLWFLATSPSLMWNSGRSNAVESQTYRTDKITEYVCLSETNTTCSFLYTTVKQSLLKAQGGRLCAAETHLWQWESRPVVWLFCCGLNINFDIDTLPKDILIAPHKCPSIKISRRPTSPGILSFPKEWGDLDQSAVRAATYEAPTPPIAGTA